MMTEQMSGIEIIHTYTNTPIEQRLEQWGDGPWIGEPSKIQGIDPDTGYPVLAVRNSWNGSLCGYVGVAEGHPAFEKHYDDVPSGMMMKVCMAV